MAKKNRLNISALLKTPTATSGVFKTGFTELSDEIITSNQEVHQIEIDCILDSPYQTREDVDEDVFAQLVTSIQHEGFQNTISVRPFPGREGFYQIVGGGHSRRDAARIAGLTTIPVLIVDASDQAMAIRTAQENLARSDLNPVETGKLFLKIRKDLGLTQEQLADILGMKDRNRVRQCELAAQSSSDIQEMLRQKTTGGLRAMIYLRRLENYPEERKEIIERFLSGALTTDGVHKAVENVLHPPQIQPISITEYLPIENADTLAIAQPFDVQESNSDFEEFTNIEQDENGVVKTVTKTTETTKVHETVTVQSPQSILKEQTQVMERIGKLTDIYKRFQRYQRILGESVPSENERQTLQDFREEIDELLQIED